MVKHTFTGDTMTYFADNPNYSETQILFAIESFIIDIFSTGFKQAQLPVFKKLLEQFEPIYNIDYYYYDYISVFISLKLIIDQMRYDLNNEHPDNYEFVLGLDNEHLNYLEITAKSMRAKVQQDLHQFGLQEENNTKSLVVYAEDLFNHYSKLLIVRVDLGYTNEAKNNVDIDRFYRHFEVMRNRLSNKDTFFKDLQGYSWAIEQGKQKGYHVHLLLIYDGAKVQNGSYYAQRTGEKWQEITKDEGSYFNLNCNEYKNKLRRAGCEIGLGMLSRNNEGDWDLLLAVIGYLTLVREDKVMQRLRVKVEKNMQTFGKGQFGNTKRRGIDRT
jgi:hypothetical protein